MFKILNPNKAEDVPLRIQFHELRYKVFVEQLGWKNGIIVIDHKEYDEFDHQNAYALVHVNDNGKVDAGCRLTQTDSRYLLDHAADVYTGCVSDKNILPHSERYIEISRVCSDARTAPRDILGRLFACIQEYALKTKCLGAVSFSDERILVPIKRTGWNYEPLGAPVFTSTDMSLGLRLPINDFYFERIRKKVNMADEAFPQIPWPMDDEITAIYA